MSYPTNQYNGHGVRTLSRPIKSTRSGTQKHHSVYDQPMYSSQNNLAAPESQKRLNSESDSMPTHNGGLSAPRPLHSEFSASQPILHRLDVQASAFYADNERHNDIAYPSLLKHSLGDLLHEPGPIPVQVPSVPNGHAFSNGVSNPKLIPPPVPVRRSVLSCYDNVTESNPSTAVIRQRNSSSQIRKPVGNPGTHSLNNSSVLTPNIDMISRTQGKYSNVELSFAHANLSQPIPVPTPSVPTQHNSIDQTDHPSSATYNRVYGLQTTKVLQSTRVTSPTVAPKPTKDSSTCMTTYHSAPTAVKFTIANDATSASMAPNVNNIPHTAGNKLSVSKPNEPYRLRSLSYSGVFSSAPPMRPRSHSHSIQPASQISLQSSGSSDDERVNDASSSSDEDGEEDSTFVRSPIHTEPQATEVNQNKTSFMLPPRLKTAPTALSDLITTTPSLPTKVRIIRGALYPSGGVPIPSGNDLSLHFVKHTKVFSVQDNNGVIYMLPYNSSIKLAVLHNPSNPTKLVSKGFKFRSAEDIMKQKSIPLVIAATKTWEGPTPKASVREGDILVVRGIKTDSSKGYRLMVKTVNGHKKLLPANCVAHFSTAPCLIALTLREFIQCKLKLPQHIVLQYPPIVKQNKALPSVVNILKHTKECSVIATCPSLANDRPSSKVLEIPLSIPLTVQDLQENDAILTRATENLFKNFDACVTAYCSDSPKSAALDVQSTFLKCLSSSDRAFGWKIVGKTEINSIREQNPLLKTPLHNRHSNDRLAQYKEHYHSVSKNTASVNSFGPHNGNSSAELPQADNPHIQSNINPLCIPAVQHPYIENNPQSKLVSHSPRSLSHSPEISDCDGPVTPTSNVDQLSKQIQSIEAKCSSTDSQLVEFNRQFSEVKSTLSIIRQSMLLRDPPANSTLATVQVASVDIQPQEQPIQSEQPGILGNRLHIAHQNTHDGSSGTIKSTDNNSGDKDKQKQGYFGKRLNQAKAHFGKLLQKKPTSPPLITPPATVQCLNSIPEGPEGESSLELSTAKTPQAHIEHRSLQVNDSPTHEIQHKPTKPPIILPKPPSPSRSTSKAPVAVLQQELHIQETKSSIHNGSDTQITLSPTHFVINQSTFHPLLPTLTTSATALPSRSVSSDVPLNAIQQQPSADSLYERLEGFQSAKNIPAPVITNGDSPSVLGSINSQHVHVHGSINGNLSLKEGHGGPHSKLGHVNSSSPPSKQTSPRYKPMLAPKPKHLTARKVKASPKKPALAPKPTTSNTEAKIGSETWSGGDDLDAIVDDIETWCLEIEAEVNQLTKAGTYS